MKITIISLLLLQLLMMMNQRKVVVNSFSAVASASPTSRARSTVEGEGLLKPEAALPRRSRSGRRLASALIKGVVLRKQGSTRLFSSTSKDDDDPSKESTTPQINWKRVRQQVALFRQMATPYYKESVTARWLLAGVLVLTLANSGISVLFSYVGKDFWNALSNKDTTEFYIVLSKYVGALCIGAPVATLYHYQREQLAVHWREWMTTRTFDLYTTNQVYYKLERHQGADIDNPDQRITEDVKSFTSFSLQLLITILTSIIDLCSFSAILWSIYPQLFVAIMVYATFGTVITTLLGKTLVGLNFKQLRTEADLRYSLVRLRDNAESIAFYAGEDLEGQAVETRLERVMGNRRSINAAQRNLEFFTNAYRYLVQILPVAVVAPKYFAGDIELGVISQSAGAFNHILSDLSIIINQFESLSSFSAGIERLSGFYEAIRQVDTERDATSPLLQVPNATRAAITIPSFHDSDKNLTDMVDGIIPSEQASTVMLNDSSGRSSGSGSIDKSGRSNLDSSNGSGKSLHHYYGQIDLQRWNDTTDKHNNKVLSIQDMDLVTPDQKRVLIRNLSLELRQGEHLLIVGDSGAGKSSLLRALAGLWTVGSGVVARPANDDVYFLPQRPYCTLGSLKDQLLYPSLDYSSRDDMDISTGRNIGGGDTGNKIMPRSHWLKQSLTDDDLLDILEKVNLLGVAVRAGDGDPVLGLSVVMDWSNILSLGEQQRLAFGRLLVNRPKLVILDESTSALDISQEARMYNILQEMAKRTLDSSSSSSQDGQQQALSAPGLTYVSVGHRPSLVIFHEKKLRLGGDSVEHELSEIDKSSLQITSPPNL